MVTSVVYVRVGACAVRVRNCTYEHVCPFVSIRAYLSVQCARLHVRVCAYVHFCVYGDGDWGEELPPSLFR